MQSTTDNELLRHYARDGSESAFGELVRRYADFVYSAALRQVSEPELARDVAQLVFVDLARKARTLHPDTLLIGWLCRGARLAALEQLRKQHRRVQRERQAMELVTPSTEPDPDWSSLRPVLDEAIAGLAEEDRNALLLRYFKNESLASVGATLGVSEDAAQKRVSRALGRLRQFLAQRGIHTTAAALSVALAANAVQAAPAGFAAALTAAALAQAAAPASLSLLNLLTSHSMKTAILSLVVAGGIAGLSVQQVRTQHQLRQAQGTIQQQNETLQSLQSVQQQLATQSDELQSLRTQQQELTELRGEVARLRLQAASAPKPAAAQTTLLTSPARTNASTANVGLTAKFVLLPSDDLKLLNLAWSRNQDGSAAAVLTDNQLQTIYRALDGATDIKILGSPRVVTFSGTYAKLFVGPNMSGAAAGSGFGGGGAGGGFAGSSGAGGANKPPALGSDTRPGLTLSVLPYFVEGASTFNLQLTAGFGPWADRSPQQDGSRKEVQLAQAKSQVTLGLGQTAVLAREVPNEGWTEADDPVPGPKSLLVFITPSIVHTASRLERIVNKVSTNDPSAPEQK